MNLKDLSKVVTESIQECIYRKVSLDDVDIYIVVHDHAVIPNFCQLRFDSSSENGVLIIDEDK